MKKLDLSLLMPILLTLVLLVEGYLLYLYRYRLTLSGSLTTMFSFILIVFFFAKIISGILGMLYEYFTKVGGKSKENQMEDKEDTQSGIRSENPEDINASFDRQSQKGTQSRQSLSNKKESSFTYGIYYTLIGILDLLSWTYYFYPTFLMGAVEYDVALEIIPKATLTTFSSFFCVKLLGYKLYSHKYLALFFNYLSMISSFIILTNNRNGMTLTLMITWILFGISLCAFIAIKQIAEKWLMFYKYKSPSFITLIEGLIGFFLLGFVILYEFIKEKENFTTLLKEWYNQMSEGKHQNLIILAYFIFAIILNLLAININSKYNPTYRLIADSIYCIQYCLLMNRSFASYILSFGAIPNFISALIFNEVIVIPCCGFDYNTKIAIDERERIERAKEMGEQNFDLLPTSNYNSGVEPIETSEPIE